MYLTESFYKIENTIFGFGLGSYRNLVISRWAVYIQFPYMEYGHFMKLPIKIENFKTDIEIIRFYENLFTD